MNKESENAIQRNSDRQCYKCSFIVERITSIFARQKYQFSFLNTQYSFEWDDLFTSCGSMTLHNVMMKLYEENVHMVQSVFTLSFNLIRLMCHGGEDSRGFRYCLEFTTQLWKIKL